MIVLFSDGSQRVLAPSGGAATQRSLEQLGVTRSRGDRLVADAAKQSEEQQKSQRQRRKQLVLESVAEQLGGRGAPEVFRRTSAVAFFAVRRIALTWCHLGGRAHLRGLPADAVRPVAQQTRVRLACYVQRIRYFGGHC